MQFCQMVVVVVLSCDGSECRVCARRMKGAREEEEEVKELYSHLLGLDEPFEGVVEERAGG